MKRWISLCFLTTLTAGLWLAEAQESRPETTPSSAYCQGFQAPSILRHEDTVVGYCDSLIIINPLRYRLYEEARRYVLSLDPASTARQLGDFRADLERLRTATAHREATFEQLESSYAQHLDDQEKRLSGLQMELQMARKELENSRVLLNEVQEDLRKRAKQRQHTALVFGTGGLLAGALIGMIIAQ